MIRKITGKQEENTGAKEWQNGLIVPIASVMLTKIGEQITDRAMHGQSNN